MGDAKNLKRALGLIHLIFYGVGSIVGAGIYTIIGAAASMAGNFLWISFLLAGLCAFLVVLSYSKLAKSLTKAGAEYQFMRAVFPKWPILAFMAGFLIILNASATSATVAIAFAGYLNVFIKAPIILTALGLLLICTLINIWGIKESTFVTIILTSIEVLGLFLIIIGAFIKGDMSKAFAEIPNIEQMSNILASSALIFFIYIGFEDVVNLSEEAHQPKKLIPKALLISTGITSLIYFLVALSVIALINPSTLALSHFPLTLVANKINPILGFVLGITALIATASTALIALVSISRMIFGMARDGYMPKIFSRVLKNRRTPFLAAFFLFISSSLLLSIGQIKIIASISSFGVLLVFIGIHWAAIMQKKKSLFIIIPIVGILIILFLLTQFDALVYLISGLVIMCGFFLYFIRQALRF